MSKMGSYNLRSFLEQISRYRSCTSKVSQGCGSGSKVATVGHGYSNKHGLQWISAKTGKWKKLDTNMVKDDKVRPPAPAPPRVNFPIWTRWVLGLLSLLLPFWRKWEKLKMIEGEAEIVVEEVENVAEIVERAATAVEMVSAEVAEKLPENGKLKKTALLLERVSKATAHDAQLTKDIIYKAEALKGDFKDLETMVEPVIEKLIQQKSEGK